MKDWLTNRKKDNQRKSGNSRMQTLAHCQSLLLSVSTPWLPTSLIFSKYPKQIQKCLYYHSSCKETRVATWTKFFISPLSQNGTVFIYGFITGKFVFAHKILGPQIHFRGLVGGWAGKHSLNEWSTRQDQPAKKNKRSVFGKILV